MTNDRFDPPGAALGDWADEAGPQSAEALEDAFTRAGRQIEDALERAARSGGDSFERMTERILADLARLSAERLVLAPIEGWLQRAITPPLDGARAEGGPVTAGGRYLVGEHGPEVFTPAHSGEISQSAGRAITVNIHLAAGSDAAGVEREEGRISRALARAVARGSRYL
ncbi:phage tail tape measure C-terminal domain-containing protein [Maricaulis sp.]|uniref:phage tail tape measure C-terminal domain-containing protein n=1 Tax=Maricaulis sp. TaxID=1486257 RepID=UPI0026026743|nr:phage tail tape measure C-terminal domain-containing protein [Maricaulis sp.]